MSELRKDIVTREWVIIAPERAHRGQHGPELFYSGSDESDQDFCPFCPGREPIEPEIWAWRPPRGFPNSPQWQVRVIANKFPALNSTGKLSRHDHYIYDCISGVGHHEIVVETPYHNRGLHVESASRLVHVWEAYHTRYQELRKDDRIAHISIFKNHGWAAGATIRHAHSQIVATPVIPQLVWDNIRGQQQYREYRDTCVYCNIVHTELELKERLIVSNDDFAGISPFAARYPYEMWIVPRRHSASFVEMTDKERISLARILHLLLNRLADELNDPPYNYTLFCALCNQEKDSQFHWHMEIIPRLSVIAGFELGSNIYINTVSPEEACRRLRPALQEAPEKVVARAT